MTKRRGQTIQWPKEGQTIKWPKEEDRQYNDQKKRTDIQNFDYVHFICLSPFQ
jgi:hypothetical protein